jgi:hypothetical protein
MWWIWVDNVVASRHFNHMRDDRYRGTPLPNSVRKLCRMAEREADRARPELLRRQALAALVSDAAREISPEFRRRLKDHDAAPSLFGAKDLVAAARTGLEAEIARTIDVCHGDGSKAAVSDALRRRAEGYAREQKCQLVTDRYPYATVASETVKKACAEIAPVAAELILTGQPVAKMSSRVLLTENLLVQSSSRGSL